MREITCYFTILLLSAGISHAASQDSQWAHWRGPSGNGTAPAASPPTTFSHTENVRWKAPIPGRGCSSPVLWNDSVFVTTAIPVAGSSGELDFQILCFDRATGIEKWKQTAIRATPHEGTHSTNGYASASPCTDGKHVYAHFGSQGTFCFTVDGQPVWDRDFGDMHTRNEFGEGSSPTLASEMLIVPWDHEGPSKLIAVNKITGDTIWETPRDEPTCWATPLITKDNRGREQIVMNGQTAARGYELATGKELWKCGGQTQRPCASAVAANGVAFIGSGFRGAFIGAFDLAGDGNLSGGKSVLWTHNQDTPDVASPLLSGNRLYYYKQKTGLLTCVDASTGDFHYETQRLPGMNRTYASPVAAGGHVYLTDRSGQIVVIKDSPTLEIVAENDMAEGIDATPAPVQDVLLIRGEKHLFCIGSPPK